jgi:hypothetical protein
VKADTEAALPHLERHGAGMIVWHDVREGGPEWIKVLEYLKREIAPRHYIEWIDTTWLAVLRSGVFRSRGNRGPASAGRNLSRNGIPLPKR